MAVSSLLAGATGGAAISIVINAIDNFSKTFRKVNMGMLALGAGITAIGVAGAKAVGGLTKLAGEFEQTTIAFTTMLGSAEEADKLLQELADFATKTPFTIVGVEQNAKQLIAMGIEVDNLLPTLKSLGDVSAGLSVPLQRIALNFGQVKVQGKLTGRELRDFSIAGVPLIAELAKSLNVAEKEVKEMVSAGRIGFKEVDDAFKSMTSEGGKFFNLMDKQSKSFLGQMSNVQDSLIKIARIMGEVFLPAAKFMAEQLGILVAWFEQYPTLLQFAAVVLAISTGLALIIGPLLILIAVLPLLIAGFATLSAVTLPITATFLTIAAIVLIIIASISLLIVIVADIAKHWSEALLWMKTVQYNWAIFVLKTWNEIRKAWIKMWASIGNFFMEIWNKIVEFSASRINKIINMLNPLIAAFDRLAGKFGFKGIGQIEKVTFDNAKAGLIDITKQIAAVNDEEKALIDRITVNYLTEVKPLLNAINAKKEAEMEVTDELEKQNELARQIPKNIGTNVTTLGDISASEGLLRSSGKEITSAGTVFDPTNFNSSQFQTLEDLMEAEKLTSTAPIEVNIENVYGTDPTAIVEGIQDILGDKISI